MKKIYSLVIILVAFHLAASAQYNQGRIYIDGSINYNNDKMTVTTLMVGAPIATSSNNLTISPSIGYFVANNLAVGIGLEYKSLSNSNTTLTESVFANQVLDHNVYDLTSSKWKELAPSIFAKYILPISDKLSFSIMAKFSHGLVTDEMSVNSTTISFDGKVSTSEVVSEKPSKQTNRFNISPEFQYLITNKIGLKVNFTGLSYNSLPVINHSYETVDGTRFSNVVNYGSQKTTSFNINPSSWSFGVFILLGGKNSEPNESK
jgi:hypothetical protein